MSTLAPLTIPVGYDSAHTLTVTEDGQPINLTGCTVKFNLYAFGSDELAIDPAPTLALTDAPNGVVTLALTDTQSATLTRTKTYRYGVSILDGTGLYTPAIYGLATAADIPGGV